MSWFARSLANSLRLDSDHDDDEDYEEENERNRRGKGSETAVEVTSAAGPATKEDSGSVSPGRGVKEDLSVLTKTLTRQLWGVASFLAPPPQSRPDNTSPTSPPQISASSPGSEHSDQTALRDSELQEGSDAAGIAGIRSDFAEIGGRFRSGISKLSSNKAVTEISKIASTFLPFGSEGDEEEEEGEFEEEYVGSGGAIGVTEEVLAFARNISMHPETWLDFPLLPEEDDYDDFDMSDAQQEHALAVERLAPRLAALRIELCPSHMTEGCFWKIYFVLLHPRLSKEDAERLSTPQIVEARAMLLQDLQNRTKPESYSSGGSTSYRKEPESSTPSGEQLRIQQPGGMYESTMFKAPVFEDQRAPGLATDFETEKHPVITTEIKIMDKSIIEEEPPNQVRVFSSDASKVPIQKYEDDADDWLKEEDDEGMEMRGTSVTPIPLGNEEDVSFSDLEEDEEETAPSSSKTETHTSNSQLNDNSREWVQLSKKSPNELPKDSNEWQDVDDIDLE